MSLDGSTNTGTAFSAPVSVITWVSCSPEITCALVTTRPGRATHPVPCSVRPHGRPLDHHHAPLGPPHRRRDRHRPVGRRQAGDAAHAQHRQAIEARDGVDQRLRRHPAHQPRQDRRGLHLVAQPQAGLVDRGHRHQPGDRKPQHRACDQAAGAVDGCQRADQHPAGERRSRAGWSRPGPARRRSRRRAARPPAPTRRARCRTARTAPAATPPRHRPRSRPAPAPGRRTRGAGRPAPTASATRSRSDLHRSRSEVSVLERLCDTP